MTRSGELHEPNVDSHGHGAAAGLGRSPANPRWGPHFRNGEVEVADVYEDEGDDVCDRAWLGGETVDGVLALEWELQQLGDDGWMFVVLMPNRTDLCHPGTITSPPSLRAVRNTLGFHRGRKVIPDRRFLMSLHRLRPRRKYDPNYEGYCRDQL